MDPQCDLVTGQCSCRDKVEGRRCDRCMENTRSKDTGGYGGKVCEPCDDCYNLVSDAANEHRKNLADLDELLVKIRESPEPVSQNFVQEIRQLQIKVRGVLADARINSQDQGRGNISTHYFFCVCETVTDLFTVKLRIDFDISVVRHY